MNFSRFLLVAAIVLVIYLLPSLIAFGRRNPEARSVFLINAWLGWTIVGWITAFTWALETNDE